MGQKMPFLSQAPSHHSFTFNFRFLYELKHKAPPSKTVWDFYFQFRFNFIKVIFLSNKMYGLSEFKT